LFCRHCEAETPFLDIKLRGSGQRFQEERELKLSKLASRRSQAFILSTDLGPLASSVCICPKARPSFTIHYLPFYGPPVPSHSPLLFDGNLRRYVFDPSAREKGKQKAQGRGDSKVKWVEHERKVKSGNAKKGWSRS
jgi:hypothetical protein